MNWNLLIEHLQLAILLGGLSSGVVETLKEWFFKDLKGNTLTLVSVGLTALVSAFIGYFYTATTLAELGFAIIWGVVGAQAVYATVKKLKGEAEEIKIVPMSLTLLEDENGHKARDYKAEADTDIIVRGYDDEPIKEVDECGDLNAR